MFNSSGKSVLCWRKATSVDIGTWGVVVFLARSLAREEKIRLKSFSECFQDNYTPISVWCRSKPCSFSPDCHNTKPTTEGRNFVKDCLLKVLEIVFPNICQCFAMWSQESERDSRWFNCTINQQDLNVSPLLLIKLETTQIGAIQLWRPQKNPVFDLLPPVHMRRTPSPLWTSTYGRHEIHTALLKRLVQWHTGPKAKIWLWL